MMPGHSRAAQPAALPFDIVINGGSLAAPAAALEAARANPAANVLLLEPTDWLGGQATSQGVAAIDNAWHDPGASLMRNNPALYYPADYRQWIADIKSAPPEAPGEGYAGDAACWVSREAFDPRTAAWVLDNQLATLPNITVMKMTVVKDVATSPVLDANGPGLVIQSLRVIQRVPVAGYKPFDQFLSQEILDWYSPADSPQFTKTEYAIVPRDAHKGLVVIDASELADVVVLSGAVYVVGRELVTEKIADDGTLPAHDEDGSQSFVYPFCMTDAPSPTAETELQSPWSDFAAYYQQQIDGFFSLGAHTWTSVWTYRRLKNTGAPGNGNVNPGDVTMQNWYPGNDYPYGTLYKNLADTAAETADWMGGVNVADLARAEQHAVAFYFYMKSYTGRAIETRYLNGDDPLNMMDTKTGLAKFPYIRETRRIVGLDNFRILERYFTDVDAPGYTTGSSFRYHDSIGIGCYAVDVHPTKLSTGINISIHRPAPFYIPYRALGSVNVRNLLAAGKLLAGTFISNAAYRLHPIEWSIGSAAGGAAAIMARDAKTNYDLLDIPTLRALQTQVNLNSPISWAVYDAQPLPPQNGDLIFNDRKIVNAADFPVLLEIYHHLGVRARVSLNGEFIGETTTKANGRLLYSIAAAPMGDNLVAVECYNAEGDLLDTLTGTLFVNTPPTSDPWVVDDSESEFTVTGLWTTASSQPDKYADTYHYAQGGSGENTATWQLHTPEPGLYEVSIWYPAAYNRAIDSPFTVYSADGSKTIRVNQQVNGGQWVSLGTFKFSGPGTGRVVVTNDVSNPSLLVLADAVRTQFLGSINGFVTR